ncbi:MAG: sulfurtransferase [gamma proteobacterium symbiont of Stewartia floridana]|nr:MAG: sulfurtransferase [gamma proteobacterium symbiont of Stewartia floridana]RLW61752.1 MAG: sulfurtransferase [gamma proteobacterium symbiont of Stewartia floridana]
MNRCVNLIIRVLLMLSPLVAVADETAEAKQGDELSVKLSSEKPYTFVIHEGRSIRVQRIQDPDYQLKGYYAKTARKCPPFCLQPMQVDPRVATIGEIELFDFMEGELRDKTGLLIDARTAEWFNRGTIPGSINLPFTQLSKPGTAEMEQALLLFGARPRVDVGAISLKLEELGLLGDGDKTDKWDFSNAKKLVLWCNGPECGQSPRAIKGLLKVGYPADKIVYYRGGMQLWQLWGLTTVVPGE